VIAAVMDGMPTERVSAAVAVGQFNSVAQLAIRRMGSYMKPFWALGCDACDGSRLVAYRAGRSRCAASTISAGVLPQPKTLLCDNRRYSCRGGARGGAAPPRPSA
jgi:hypothetical protein